jgi:hypothetical protein
MAEVAESSYFLTTASEPKLTNSDEFHEANRGLKVGKTQGPNSLPNKALKHFPQRVIPPRPDFQRGSPHPSLSISAESPASDHP